MLTEIEDYINRIGVTVTNGPQRTTTKVGTQYRTLAFLADVRDGLTPAMERRITKAFTAAVETIPLGLVNVVWRKRPYALFEVQDGKMYIKVRLRVAFECDDGTEFIPNSFHDGCSRIQEVLE
jgi:hypothetical protein